MFQCGWFRMHFNLEVQDWENMFILSHIIIDTFYMYMNQVTSNKYNEFYWSSMICSWMHLPWFSSAFVLEHMHLALASNNNNVSCMHLYFVKNHIWILHRNLNVTKIIPKNNGNDIFIHCNITFWSQKNLIISCHIFLLPCFHTCQTSYIQ